ncbi:hypothetical protein CEXT_704811 [Caerostris extrusa]|uniref:Uncharacterized protein n=1 Tax=Caerostris extrusa TaxID=172846 RepID=A0AAV4XG75_CAEEX|nr:hypothetical protein CEXT_704811 [Caerostris extrusa]
MRTNVYIISVMIAHFNRFSGQTCSELQLVHFGKEFFCPLSWWSSLDGKDILEPRYYTREESEEFCITAGMKFLSWSDL